jgi:hypothetical protein
VNTRIPTEFEILIDNNIENVKKQILDTLGSWLSLSPSKQVTGKIKKDKLILNVVIPLSRTLGGITFYGKIGRKRKSTSIVGKFVFFNFSFVFYIFLLGIAIFDYLSTKDLVFPFILILIEAIIFVFRFRYAMNQKSLIIKFLNSLK